MKKPLVPGTIVTLEDITQFFDVDRRTVNRWRKERNFPDPRTYGGVQRWRAEEVLRWMFQEENSLDNLGQSGTSDPDGPAGASKREKRG